MREKRRCYFTLKEVHAKSPKEALYIPVSSAAFLRPVIGRAQAEAYLNGIALLEPDPGLTSHTAGVTARYRAMIDACDLVETLKLLKALYLKTRAIGKSQKLPEVDIQYRDIADKVICDEFAYALGVTPKEIKEKLLAAIHRKKAAKGKRDPVHLHAQPDEEADN